MPAAPLRDLYAALGVHFREPSAANGGSGTDRNGGAILNQDANVGVDARSGINFLAFSANSPLNNGDFARDPEDIVFDTPVGSFSIFASGGYNDGAFTLEAFDAAENLLGSSAITTLPLEYGELRVDAPGGGAGITTVTFLRTPGAANNTNVFVLDDLTATSLALVPEPGTFALVALLPLAAVQRRRQRRLA